MRVALSDRLNHRLYISGGHLATTGDRAVPHIYLVDNSRMLADVGYELAPLRVRVLEHINDARQEAGLPAIRG